MVTCCRRKSDAVPIAASISSNSRYFSPIMHQKFRESKYESSQTAVIALEIARSSLSNVVRSMSELRPLLEEASKSGPTTHTLRTLDLLFARHHAALNSVFTCRPGYRATKPRVVIAGKTKAGKTTLRNALIGRGDGFGIGRGGQRTTRTVSECEWGDIVLKDTPGTAALDGEQDTLLASEAASSADLLLYILDDDAIREEEVRALARLRATGVPVLLAVNVKFDLQRPLNLRRFLADPSCAFRPDELDGHRRRIEAIAPRLGLRSSEPLAIHAQAATLAFNPEYAANAIRLLASSRLDVLSESLLTALSGSRAAMFRLRATHDAALTAARMIPPALAYAAVACASRERDIGDLAERLRRGLKAEIEAIRREAKELPGEWFRPIRGAVQPFLEEHLEASDIAARWRIEFDRRRLAETVEQWCGTAIGRIIAEASDIEMDAARVGYLGPEAGQVRPWSGTDWRSYARWGTSGTGLALAGLALAGIAAAPIALAIAAIAALGIGADLSLRPHSERLAAARERRAKSMLRHLDGEHERLQHDLSTWVREQVEQEIERTIDRLQDSAKSWAELGRIVGLEAERLWNAVDCADLQLLAALAEHASLPVPKGFLMRSVRVPGVAWKMLVAGSAPNDILAPLEPLLSESVHLIRCGDPAIMVAASLAPAQVVPTAVRLPEGGGPVTVLLHPKEAAAARGPNERNLEAAGRALGTPIFIEEREGG